jgi:hypothetical protein
MLGRQCCCGQSSGTSGRGALAAGTGAWFAGTLRQPEQIGDLSDLGRPRMPALMRGADGRNLALTRRQIDTIAQAVHGTWFAGPTEEK